ncbi:MAG TPA: hypothetical protein PKA95_14010 [Thermomicrobiales bacterium]|nr:hypothetical protein [Thermomicrobiales bacterium]
MMRRSSPDTLPTWTKGAPGSTPSILHRSTVRRCNSSPRFYLPWLQPCEARGSDTQRGGLSVIADSFGGGNALQALFNFILHRYLFLGLAQESADSIRFGMKQLPPIPRAREWVNFLRHHDELNLSRLTKEQREQVFAAFGPDVEPVTRQPTCSSVMLSRSETSPPWPSATIEGKSLACRCNYSNALRAMAHRR